MDNEKFIKKCKSIIFNYLSIEDIYPIDIYVVWICKTLQNNKALLSTPLNDGRYYEITYNGDKNEFYFDAYKKFESRLIEGEFNNGNNLEK